MEKKEKKGEIRGKEREKGGERKGKERRKKVVMKGERRKIELDGINIAGSSGMTDEQREPQRCTGPVDIVLLI